MWNRKQLRGFARIAQLVKVGQAVNQRIIQ
jgi:hypothetical protein